jgi:chromosome partitioning protein
LLKKGRGLRKRTRGGPEEAETPVDGEASEITGSDAGMAAAPVEAVVVTADAPFEDPPPPPPAMSEAPVDPEPIAVGDTPEPVEVEEILEVLESVDVVDLADEPTAEAAPPADEPTAEAAPTAEPIEAVTAPEPAVAEGDDDEPPLPLPRAVPVPDGPVLETAKLPEVAVEAEGFNPLTLPRVIAIANQKGGVGKTTTTVNLGAALAELGFRVLVLDLDPQGNATTGLGLNPRDVEGSVYDVLLNDVALEDIIEPTSLKHLFVAPATIDLAGAEIELVPVMSRELKLKKAIDQVRDQYELVLIDCPPSLGLLTVNGLAASDDVIVPIQCEYYALEGLGQLLRNVGLVQANLNPALDIRGIILTMYDARTKLADQVVSEVRAYFGPKVYETVVPRTVRLSEAPSFGQPIIVFDSTSRGAKAYRDLAKEVSRGATGRAG